MKQKAALSLCLLFLLLEGCKPAGSAAWVPVTSTVGKFRAAYPLKPSEYFSDVPFGTINLTLHHLASGRGDGCEYDVIWADFPPEYLAVTSSQVVLQSVRDGYVTGKKKVRSESLTTVNGNRARVLEADMGDGNVVRVKLFFVGNRVYNLMAVTPASSPDDPDTQKFFDSFALLP
jgi:hypothetical protein